MSFYYKKTLFKFFSKYSHKDNPKVFIKVQKDGQSIGKLVFELYSNLNPKTAANFLSLCKGDKKITYKNSIFHRVIPDFMAQGGDITNGNGTGGMSIYGRTFPDENMTVKHIQRGMLSMANSGPNTNGSQFFITFIPCEWLDGKHTVFGEMIEGEEVLKIIEKQGSRTGKTTSVLKIEDCGEVVETAKKI
jgi:peptidylprolyl isomerase